MAAKRIAIGSAADLFGWTGELLRHLALDKQALPLLVETVKAIIDGNVPNSAREWLLASWLVPLDKGQGKNPPNRRWYGTRQTGSCVSDGKCVWESERSIQTVGFAVWPFHEGWRNSSGTHHTTQP